MSSEKEDSLRTLEQEHRVKVWSHNGLVKTNIPQGIVIFNFMAESKQAMT